MISTQEVESQAAPSISIMSKRTRYEMFRAHVVKKHGIVGAPEKEIERMVRLEIELLVSRRTKR